MVVDASESTSQRHVLYNRSPLSLPTGWHLVSDAPMNGNVSFMIALRQQHLDQLESLFEAVSLSLTVCVCMHGTA